MTTKLAYRIQSVIDYDSLSFDPDEPESLPDAMFQYQILEEILHVLGTHITTLHPSEEVFRSSNTFICYEPDDLNVRVGPDFYAAFGVDARSHRAKKAVPTMGGWEAPRLRAGNRLGKHGSAGPHRETPNLCPDWHSRILAL